jgi:hypothetical protein
VLDLDMIEILPPLGKYKYDTWRILPVKCYTDNSVRLWSYIQNINTSQSLNDIFRNHDSSGRIRKWAMELSEHVVDFEKRSSVKSQVLADFIVDWTEPLGYTKGTVVEMPWQVYSDRA